MARVVRRAFAAAGIAVLAMAASVQTSVAAVAPGVDGTTIASVQPTNGQVVGVAMPITVTFTSPVTDRWAAQQSITVTSPANVAGRFEWLDDKTVQFVPAQYWPAHSEITMMAGGIPRTFGTGSKVLGVADISAHTFTVSIDGQVVRQMPASMGKSRFPTPIGSFNVLEKQSSVVMDSRTIGIPLSDPEGYKLTVADAVRVTWGGVYVHSAPWSVGSQGYSNVSHGCINLSPDNAAWYFDQVHIGDPVVVNA
ncbi:L,D-transpeptidase [Mycobacterium sp. CVI_P3]|uniref:L,D-transpeptidase n=1 Tax=Mycobacterium pinniadriaticum TaxID=2994102 RepID=A0ABT3S921_9MYCO|nr:L,D-transpeptidase [Mycobacterium pinniadriaticum]MCX2929578.1 L,D-transpeptidase [Mycobacterium pinniadriaticum]MCX2936002.1 L,D-transpeptidase [Mycobacterium pinniadriaticum]